MSPTGEEIVKVGVSYDMGWRKRGHTYGMGSAIGVETGKVLSYGTHNTMCQICLEAENGNKKPGAHDCRRNHQGSSKSMELQLFSNAIANSMSYSTYVGDDDSTT